MSLVITISENQVTSVTITAPALSDLSSLRFSIGSTIDNNSSEGATLILSSDATQRVTISSPTTGGGEISIQNSISLTKDIDGETLISKGRSAVANLLQYNSSDKTIEVEYSAQYPQIDIYSIALALTTNLANQIGTDAPHPEFVVNSYSKLLKFPKSESSAPSTLFKTPSGGSWKTPEENLWAASGSTVDSVNPIRFKPKTGNAGNPFLMFYLEHSGSLDSPHSLIDLSGAPERTVRFLGDFPSGESPSASINSQEVRNAMALPLGNGVTVESGSIDARLQFASDQATIAAINTQSGHVYQSGVSTFEYTFSDANLSINGALAVTHNLNTYPSGITIWSNTGEIIAPDDIDYVTLNSIAIYLTNYRPLPGVWRVSITP